MMAAPTSHRELALLFTKLALGKPVLGSGVRIWSWPFKKPNNRVTLWTEFYQYQEELSPDQIDFIGPNQGVMELSDDELEAWDGYEIEVFGWETDPQIVPEGAPTWTINLKEENRPPITLLLIRQWARYKDSPLRAEHLWIPGEGPRRSLQWLAEGEDTTDLRRARRGLQLLQGQLQPAYLSSRRRPPYYTFPEDDATFFTDLQQAVHEAVRRGADVNLTALAAIGVGPARDRHTVGMYIDDSGYDLEKIRTEAKRCVNRLSNCSVNVRDRAKFKKNRA